MLHEITTSHKTHNSKQNAYTGLLRSAEVVSPPKKERKKKINK